MKKLIFTLLLSAFLFTSCEKETPEPEPTSINCDCGRLTEFIELIPGETILVPGEPAIFNPPREHWKVFHPCSGDTLDLWLPRPSTWEAGEVICESGVFPQ